MRSPTERAYPAILPGTQLGTGSNKPRDTAGVHQPASGPRPSPLPDQAALPQQAPQGPRPPLLPNQAVLPQQAPQGPRPPPLPNQVALPQQAPEAIASSAGSGDSYVQARRSRQQQQQAAAQPPAPPHVPLLPVQPALRAGEGAQSNGSGRGGTQSWPGQKRNHVVQPVQRPAQHGVRGGDDGGRGDRPPSPAQQKQLQRHPMSSQQQRQQQPSQSQQQQPAGSPLLLAQQRQQQQQPRPGLVSPEEQQARLMRSMRRQRQARSVWSVARRLTAASPTTTTAITTTTTTTATTGARSVLQGRGRASSNTLSGEGLQETGVLSPALSPGHVLLLQLSRYRPAGLDDGRVQVASTAVSYHEDHWQQALTDLDNPPGHQLLQQFSLQQLCFIIAALAAARHPCPPALLTRVCVACAARLEVLVNHLAGLMQQQQDAQGPQSGRVRGWAGRAAGQATGSLSSPVPSRQPAPWPAQVTRYLPASQGMSRANPRAYAGAGTPLRGSGPGLGQRGADLGRAGWGGGGVTARPRPPLGSALTVYPAAALALALLRVHIAPPPPLQRQGVAVQGITIQGSAVQGVGPGAVQGASVQGVVQGVATGADGWEAAAVERGRVAQLLQSWLQLALQQRQISPHSSRHTAIWLANLTWCLAALPHHLARSPSSSPSSHPRLSHSNPPSPALPPHRPLAMQLSGLSQGLLRSIARSVLLQRGQHARLLTASHALHLAAALSAWGRPAPPLPTPSTTTHTHHPHPSPVPTSTRPNQLGFFSNTSQSTATGSVVAADKDGGWMAVGTAPPPVVQLAVRRLVRQAHRQVGQLGPSGMAAAVAAVAAGGGALREEAQAPLLVGTRARQAVSLMQRMSKLLRARVHVLKPRELTVVLASLTLLMHHDGQGWQGGGSQPGASRESHDSLLLDEVARWTANKLFNARTDQAIFALLSLASIRWYNPHWWSKAGRYLVRVSTAAARAGTGGLNPQQLQRALGAFAAVDHAHPALLAHATEVLLLQLVACRQQAGGEAARPGRGEQPVAGGQQGGGGAEQPVARDKQDRNGGLSSERQQGIKGQQSSQEQQSGVKGRPGMEESDQQPGMEVHAARVRPGMESYVQPGMEVHGARVRPGMEVHGARVRPGMEGHVRPGMEAHVAMGIMAGMLRVGYLHVELFDGLAAAMCGRGREPGSTSQSSSGNSQGSIQGFSRSDGDVQGSSDSSTTVQGVGQGSGLGQQAPALLCHLAAGCAALGHVPQVLLDTALEAALKLGVQASQQEEEQGRTASGRSLTVHAHGQHVNALGDVCYALLAAGRAEQAAAVLTTLVRALDGLSPAVLQAVRLGPGCAAVLLCSVVASAAKGDDDSGDGNWLSVWRRVPVPKQAVLQAAVPAAQRWWSSGTGPGVGPGTPLPPAQLTAFTSLVKQALTHMGGVSTAQQALPVKATPGSPVQLTTGSVSSRAGPASGAGSRAAVAVKRSSQEVNPVAGTYPASRALVQTVVPGVGCWWEVPASWQVALGESSSREGQGTGSKTAIGTQASGQLLQLCVLLHGRPAPVPMQPAGAAANSVGPRQTGAAAVEPWQTGTSQQQGRTAQGATQPNVSNPTTQAARGPGPQVKRVNKDKATGPSLPSKDMQEPGPQVKQVNKDKAENMQEPGPQIRRIDRDTGSSLLVTQGMQQAVNGDLGLRASLVRAVHGAETCVISVHVEELAACQGDVSAVAELLQDAIMGQLRA